jgi:hypothetical protein
MNEEIRQALLIADLNHRPLTWDERHSTVEAAYTALAILQNEHKFMSEQIDKLNTEMPCGHLARYAVNQQDGTQYCAMCAALAPDKERGELRRVLQPFADAYKNVFHEYADGESLDGFDEVYVKHLHDAADVLEK